MRIIWFGLFVEIIILTLIKPLILDFEDIAILAILIHVLLSMLVFFSYKGKYKFVFLSAFLTRVVFMFWDLYARHIYVLPNSGADSEGYFHEAVYFSKSLGVLINEPGGFYSKINGFLFYLIGPQRIFAQYINVLLGLSVVFIVYKIFILLDINSKVCSLIVLLVAFFPNSLIMSAILLREIFPTFFVAVSLYYFCTWFKTPGYPNMVKSLILLAIAGMFHSGVIGILIGYIFAFLFYKNEEKKFKFSNKTVISFILLVVVFSVAYTYFGDKILYKFRSSKDISDIIDTANHSGGGGSGYLSSLVINNPIQLLAFGPLKSFFFLTAPLPMNWRGFMDIFTFFSDSSLYLLTIIYLLKNRKSFGDRKNLIVCLVWMIIGAAIIFGIGVGNAGTAVRHRQKLVPLFSVLLGVMMDGKKKNNLSRSINY